MEHQDNIIQHLVQDNSGWDPLPVASKVVVTWLLSGFVITTLFMAFTFSGFREGFFAQLQESPQFLFEIVGAIALCGILAFLGLSLSTPGSIASYRNPKLRYLLPLAAILLVSYLVYASIHPALTPSMAGKRIYCLYEALLYGGVLSAFYFRMLLKRAPLYPVPAAIAGGISSALIPAILMQMGCMYDPIHALKYHYGPILLLAGAGFTYAYFLVKRDVKTSEVYLRKKAS